MQLKSTFTLNSSWVVKHVRGEEAREENKIDF